MRTTLYWIDGPWQGRLAIAPRPRGGDWLEDEVRAWREAGLEVVVSLLTPDEVVDFDLPRQAQSCRSHGVEFISFPIPDRGTPASSDAVSALVHDLARALAAGKGVGLHCRQGIGRSALLAACLLAASGLDADAAFRRIRAARGCPVPDTVEQQEWVKAFAAQPAAVREATLPWRANSKRRG
ncbi:MAG: dual specificity protein phosphatase family protein [Verrucomicrobia bacterium]|nr:dual specificity protein phosphatase family protein [Verrucomicrobiota bacterium]